jgi:hypothetical protein
MKAKGDHQDQDHSDKRAGRLDHVSGGPRQLRGGGHQTRVHSDKMVHEGPREQWPKGTQGKLNLGGTTRLK